VIDDTIFVIFFFQNMIRWTKEQMKRANKLEMIHIC